MILFSILAALVLAAVVSASLLVLFRVAPDHPSLFAQIARTIYIFAVLFAGALVGDRLSAYLPFGFGREEDRFIFSIMWLIPVTASLVPQIRHLQTRRRATATVTSQTIDPQFLRAIPRLMVIAQAALVLLVLAAFAALAIRGR